MLDDTGSYYDRAWTLAETVSAEHRNNARTQFKTMRARRARIRAAQRTVGTTPEEDTIRVYAGRHLP
ncbi:hypothetical protein JCM16408A_53030 [Methylobacterium phyllosphaerae]